MDTKVVLIHKKQEAFSVYNYTTERSATHKQTAKCVSDEKLESLCSFLSPRGMRDGVTCHLEWKWNHVKWSHVEWRHVEWSHVEWNHLK